MLRSPHAQFVNESCQVTMEHLFGYMYCYCLLTSSIQFLATGRDAAATQYYYKVRTD